MFTASLHSSVSRLAGLVLVVAFLTTCGGCAFGDRTAGLQYRQVADAQESDAGSGKTVAVALFQDLRQGQDIGEVRNGFWIKTARVKAKEADLGGWVSSAVSMELAHRKYNVQNVDVPPPGVQACVSGTLNECYTKLKFFGSPQCTVRLTFKVDKQGATVLSREYLGTSPVALVFCTADEWGDGTENALRDAMKKAMPEVVEALK